MTVADADNSTDPLMGADESSQGSIRTEGRVNQGGQRMPNSFVRLPNVKFEYEGGESSTARRNVDNEVFPEKTDETGLHVYLPTSVIAKQCLTMIKRSFPGAKFVQNTFEPQESLDMAEETCQGEPSTSPDFVGFNDPDEYEVGIQNKCLATRRSTLGLKRLEYKTLGKKPGTNGPMKVDIKKILRLKGARRKKRKRIFTMKKQKLHAPTRRVAPATAAIADSSPKKKRGRPYNSSLPISSVVNEETRRVAPATAAIADSSPKKKRGRPFNSSLPISSVVNEETKPIASGTETSTDSPPKKKRGRPFKTSLPLELTSKTIAEAFRRLYYGHRDPEAESLDHQNSRIWSSNQIAPATETSTDSPPKKKRGRPFKTSLPLELTSETNVEPKPIAPVTETNTASPPKKKRGRPSKLSLPLELTSETNEDTKPFVPEIKSNTDSPPKKKRGRPFRSSLPLELTSVVNEEIGQMKKTEQTSENALIEDEEEIFSSPLYENTPYSLSNMTVKKKRGRPAGPLKKKLLVSSTYTEVGTEKKRRGRPPGPNKKNMIVIKKEENGVSEESIKKATEKYDEISRKGHLSKHSAEDFMPGTLIRAHKKQINFVKKRGQIPVKLGTFDVTPTADNNTNNDESEDNGFGLIITNVITDNSTYINEQPEGENNVEPPKFPCQAQDSLENSTSFPGLITENTRTDNSTNSNEQLEGDDNMAPPKLPCQAQDSVEDQTSEKGLIHANNVTDNSTNSHEQLEGDDNMAPPKLPCQAQDSVEDQTSEKGLINANNVTDNSTNSKEQLEGEDNVAPPKFPCQAQDSVEDQTSDKSLINANNVADNSTNSNEQLEGEDNVAPPGSVEDPSDLGLTYVNSLPGNNSEQQECFKPKSPTAESFDKTASPVKPPNCGIESETTSTESYTRETQENSVPIVVSVASISYEDLQ